MVRVLQIGASRKTLGGVSTVLKEWKGSIIWEKYKCRWIETQDNRSFIYKVYYWISSVLISFFLIPRYDVVHFHTTPGRSIYVQMPVYLLSLFFHKKIIVELHVGNQLSDFAEDHVFKWVLRKADKVVVLAYVWKRLIINSFSIPEEKVFVLYNPAPTVNRSNIKENYILYMAYLVKNKGYDLVIKSFARATQNNGDWRLIVAGSGEMERAKAIAKQCGAIDRIVFKGWVSGDEKQDLWQHASGYCMASYQEGFPMTVLESWAYGVPLITTPVGGLPDVIVNNENALVFDFGDEEGLSQCFTRLMESKDLRVHLSRESLQLANSIFNMDSICKCIDSLYSSVS